MGLTPHQQEALDYSRHISLTANAGSGKTFVLSKRYLQIALNENIPLRNIAAITFTDKAAGELYKKISKEIDDLAALSSDSMLLKKLEKIRRQLVSANISTIHSFCIDILREYPVEAQLDANFTPIDQLTSDELIEMSVEEIIKESLNIEEQAEEIKSLIRLLGSKSKLSSETSILIANRKNVGEASLNYGVNDQATADFFYQSFLKSAADILQPHLLSVLPLIGEINNDVLRENRSNSIALETAYLFNKLQTTKDFEQQLILLHSIRDQICTSTGSIKNRGYVTGELRKELNGILTSVADFFKEAECFMIPGNHKEVELELACFGRRMLSFFNKCLDRYETKKKSDGYLDYEDLLICTKNLLQNEQVQLSLSEKFRYIMIDEYQDTNEIQYAIFLPVLDYLKKNNLFVVGDEKQSIYMFRDAELEVFTRTREDISKSAGERSILTLPDTFRMAPGLCVFTNELFRNLFSAPDIHFNEVEHSDIICARPEEAEGAVEILTVERDHKDEEADLVARRLIELTSEGKYKWGGIAVLCRKRKSFAELEKSFVKYGIPYSILGGKGFYQRQSIYDIYNYFAFLLDDQNDSALAGILRSPFFNVSDAELYKISLMPGKSFWSKLKRYSLTDALTKEAVSTLEENLLLSRNYDVTPLLRKILNESGYHAVVASATDGKQEAANISKLIRLTTNYFSHGYKTLYDYVNFLKDAIETEEDEAQAAVSEESDSVKIMTVHQAKGLEYPVVVLFKSDETSKKTTPRSKEIIVDKKFGLLTKVPVHNDYFRPYHSAPVLNLSTYITGKKTIAEIKRLLYVAVTRAEDLLIISTALPEREKNDSFTGLLSKGLGIDFTGPGISITSRLKLLRNSDGQFTPAEKEINLFVPVKTEIGETSIPSSAPAQAEQNYIFDLQTITDTQKGEIISATKYSVYKECPVKYNLIYQYGFSELHNIIRQGASFPVIMEKEEETEENFLKKYADIKGSVIHKLLQQEILPGELNTAGISKIKAEVKNLPITEEEKVSISNSILEELLGYFSSSMYRKIKGYRDFKNEFNIYLHEKDYFLFGIIDKFIRENGRGIILDYKTDDIGADELTERSLKYFNQLKFYSYIVKSAFKSLSEIELRIVYLKHPERDISVKMTPEMITETGSDVELMVQSVRSGKLTGNRDHCRKCYFSVNYSECIIT